MQVRFRGIVETGQVAQNLEEQRYWTAIRVPAKLLASWPERRSLRVRGTVNGFAVRTSLFGGKANGYLLLVNKAMQRSGVSLGSMAEVAIEPDLVDRSTNPPPELARLFKADREVRQWFSKLPEGMRAHICGQVAESKSKPTRERRAEQWVECMMLTMEGEVEPPPVLQLIFRRQPAARTGWEAMTPIQRRTQLFSIFNLRTPAARAKRAERAAEEALRVADRLSGRASGRASGRDLDFEPVSTARRPSKREFEMMAPREGEYDD